MNRGSRKGIGMRGSWNPPPTRSLELVVGAVMNKGAHSSLRNKERQRERERGNA